MSQYQFHISDQVITRRPLANNLQSIRIGTIVAFADPETAIVYHPADRTRVRVPIDQLEPVNARFGRTSVQVDPVRRGIAFLRK